MALVFARTFHVSKQTETTDGEAYKNFIKDVRTRVKDRNSQNSHNVPLLHLQEDPPTRWFDINLKTDSHMITMRIRYDNLYWDGFRADNSDQWYEFGWDKRCARHLIPGSTFLNLGSGYTDLDFGERNDRRRRVTNLNLASLIASINDIAEKTHSKRSMLVVVQMICEAIRYESICNHLGFTYLQEDNVTPPDWMLQLENGWGAVCAAMLRVDASPNADFLPQPNDVGIETTEQAANALGIILKSGQSPLGQPMVEVFQLLINYVDGSYEKQLFGEVSVSDGLTSQYVYKGGRYGDTIDVESSGWAFAMLNGPSRYISASDSININVDLKEKDSLKEVIRGDKMMSWNVYDATNNIKYDEPIYQEIRGEHGLATLIYIVFSDAKAKTVELTLSKDAYNSAQIHGLIMIRSKKLMNSSILFKKYNQYDAVCVGPGESVPLSRSVVAVPADSSFIVTIILDGRYDRKGEASPHRQDYTPDFPSVNENLEIDGSVRTFHKDCGVIQVNITST